MDFFFIVMLGFLAGVGCGAAFVLVLWKKSEDDRKRLVAELKGQCDDVFRDMNEVHQDLLARRGVHLDA